MNNIVEANDVDSLPHEGDHSTQPSLDTHSTSKVPEVGTHQGSDCTSPEPSPTESSRGPKCHKKIEEVPRSCTGRRSTSRLTRPGLTTLERQNGNNVRQRRGCMRMQDQAHRFDVSSGKSDPRPLTNVGTVPQTEAPRPRFPAAIKTPRFEDSSQPVLEQSRESLAQRIGFVIISDTEQDSSG